MAKNIINRWDRDFLDRSRIFQDLKTVLKQPLWQDWPGCKGLMTLIHEPIKLQSGKTLKMLPQDENLPYPEMGYEERIYKTGIISTREQNWHDLFNAFIWLLFPRTKTLLNQLHMQQLEIQAGKKRTPLRDAITHLDESGIIVASSNAGLIQALSEHQWKTVFLHRQSLWWQEIGAYIFGHGLYEKAFNPFIGFTGKAYYLIVEEDFFQLGKTEQYRHLDTLLERDIRLNDTLAQHGFLKPLPILGVPGWHAGNQDEDFYNNTDYFRPLTNQ